MFSSTFQYNLATYLYPLPPPSQKRTRPLQVICLGLPRSGTDSLRNALIILGYDHVSHGIDFWANHANHSILYAKLALLRNQDNLPDAESLRTAFFDRILGDCQATTDIPSVWFAHELLAAYPDAKVILNRRRDVEAWKRSFAGSVQPLLESWRYWLHSWFDAELFWGMGLSINLHTKWLFAGDFERNAERAYVEHYKGLEKTLIETGRPYLKWGVEDEWSVNPPQWAVPYDLLTYISGNRFVDI